MGTTTRGSRAPAAIFSRAPAAILLAGALALSSTGCALSDGSAARTAVTDDPVLVGQHDPTLDPAFAVAGPGPFTGRVVTPDLVVVGPTTLPERVRRQVKSADGVRATLTVSLATAPVRGRMVTLAAGDPAGYRRFTPAVTARADEVWQRVSEGDIALAPELADELEQPLGGDLVLGDQADALTLRVGAEASMAPGIDAVVNQVRGEQIGMIPGNAILVATGGSDPVAVAEALRARVGRRVTVSSLGPVLPTEGRQTAFLTGGSVAQAVGSFTYRYFADGSVEPDPAWVAANLRTEVVPVLGTVTCHRVMLPQLRGAMQEVVDLGLASSIDTSDFGGCYAPRFIARDPAKGLSLHTWGIAVDLNVQRNLRGTSGEIDRRVVDVLKGWGFAWGGEWAYTDPMHFELAALVRP